MLSLRYVFVNVESVTQGTFVCFQHFVLHVISKSRWSLVDVSFVAVLRTSRFIYPMIHGTGSSTRKRYNLQKQPDLPIVSIPIFLVWYLDCDCPSYFKCADSSEICPPLLFIWGWLDINCVPNLCYSSKQTLPIPPHFQISKHILEFNQGCRSRKSSEKHIPSVIFEFILITFQILGMTT